MKSYGDIPKEDKKLVEELTILEEWFYSYGKDLPVLSIAKGMTCIGYDYYMMEMEEEGSRLLKLADKYCPGYFTGPIYSQIEKDLDFFYLIENLKNGIGFEDMASLGFKNEPL